jgi:hypothetical protein
MSEKPTVDTSWEMKWMRSLRKRAINILARIENDRKPTQELHYELRKAMEAFTYWNSDTAMWEKHQMIIPTTQPIPRAEIQESEVDPIDSN